MVQEIVKHSGYSLGLFLMNVTDGTKHIFLSLYFMHWMVNRESKNHFCGSYMFKLPNSILVI